MKAIHNKVNIVPVIAKADTLSLKERERLKKRVSILLAINLPEGTLDPVLAIIFKTLSMIFSSFSENPCSYLPHLAIEIEKYTLVCTYYARILQKSSWGFF